MEPSKIPNLLQEMVKVYPKMAGPYQGEPSYRYQGSENDRLFKSGYQHKEGAKTWDECDKTQMIERPIRENQDPFIHYSIGNGCLCFEMEAAGLMNDFPCTSCHSGYMWLRWLAQEQALAKICSGHGSRLCKGASSNYPSAKREESTKGSCGNREVFQLPFSLF
jgi:hypothetical protein